MRIKISNKISKKEAQELDVNQMSIEEVERWVDGRLCLNCNVCR